MIPPRPRSPAGRGRGCKPGTSPSPSRPPPPAYASARAGRSSPPCCKHVGLNGQAGAGGVGRSGWTSVFKQSQLRRDHRRPRRVARPRQSTPATSYYFNYNKPRVPGAVSDKYLAADLTPAAQTRTRSRTPLQRKLSGRRAGRVPLHPAEDRRVERQAARACGTIDADAGPTPVSRGLLGRLERFAWAQCCRAGSARCC